MKYARFENDYVAEVFTPLPGFDISECFIPEIAQQFQPVFDHIEVGWKREPDGSFTEPPSIEPPIPVNPPNWDGFNAAVLADADFNTVYGTVNATKPLLAASLPTALSQVTTNGISAFSLVYTEFCTIGNVTTEQKTVWADLAASFNLPADFITTLLS